MTRYPRYSAYRPSWTPTWGKFMFMYVVTAEDGTTGTAVGNKDHGNAGTKTILIVPVVMDKDRLMSLLFMRMSDQLIQFWIPVVSEPVAKKIHRYDQ